MFPRKVLVSDIEAKLIQYKGIYAQRDPLAECRK